MTNPDRGFIASKSDPAELPKSLFRTITSPKNPQTQCSSYFPGEPIPGLDDAIKMKLRINATTENLWKNEHLTFM